MNNLHDMAAYVQKSCETLLALITIIYRFSS